MIGRPGATDAELERADRIIETGIYSHQFYIDNPELQSKHTGNTTRNEEIIKKYEFIDMLLDRAYRWFGYGVLSGWLGSLELGSCSNG